MMRCAVLCCGGATVIVTVGSTARQHGTGMGRTQQGWAGLGAAGVEGTVRSITQVLVIAACG